MRIAVVALAACTVALAAPASATNLLTDNFDGENAGASQFNYTGFVNFNVIAPAGAGVDIIANDYFRCVGNTGSCVDLAGTPGPATLQSKNSFAFAAGDTVTLSFQISGNQRSFADPNSDDYTAGFDFGAGGVALSNYGYNFFAPFNFGPGLISAFSVTSVANPDDPFAPRSLFFTAAQAGSFTFSIGTSSADNFGPVLDNVSLDATGAVPEPASWAMMIGGAGMIGGTLRRSRMRVRAAIA